MIKEKHKPILMMWAVILVCILAQYTLKFTKLGNSLMALYLSASVWAFIVQDREAIEDE